MSNFRFWFALSPRRIPQHKTLAHFTLVYFTPFHYLTSIGPQTVTSVTNETLFSNGASNIPTRPFCITWSVSGPFLDQSEKTLGRHRNSRVPRGSVSVFCSTRTAIRRCHLKPKPFANKKALYELPSYSIKFAFIF